MTTQYSFTHISNEDRKRLEALQKALPRFEDSRVRARVTEEIAEIEAKRKPIHECNIEECAELKVVITEKMQRLAGIGKRGAAEQFKNMIRILDERIKAIYLETNRKELERLQELEDNKLEELSQPRDKRKRDHKRPKTTVKNKPGNSRWTTDIGNLD